MIKKWFPVILMVVLTVGGISIYHNESVDEEILLIDTQQQQSSVRKIRVLSGNLFDVELEDGNRFKMSLPVTAVPEATDKVIILLNDSSKPEVKLLKKEGDLWIGELYFNHQNTQIELSDWLRQNNLIYGYSIRFPQWKNHN